ncbi:hypothetical protein Egran_01759 [Elaphomyces granulatus]|uniref:Malate dehydrogenase n=1 Tax=Elaphomyces granulatus TaxID=519963 RepID=A0A232M313_9EURO|nr:hypothetical protein Egran_01759 [Elaphomyces granulatus]
MIIKVILLISFLAVGIIPAAVGATPIDALATTLAPDFSLDADLSIGGCSLNKVSPPLNYTSPKLDGPSPGLSLKYVALGRGTQNYTCSKAASNVVPTSIGAVATLFDASCLAACRPDILNAMPAVLVQIPDDAAAAAGDVSGILLADHYFADNSTPTFDFRPYGHPDWIQAKRLQGVPAPANSIPGSVPWLKLGYKAGSGIKEVYRVFTAGGNPPANCENQTSTLEVDYAAQYWFYG